MQCASCGRENRQGAVYCAFCGATFGATPQPDVPQTVVGPAVAPPPPPPPVAPPPQMPGVPYPFPAPPPEAPTSGLAVASLVLGVLGFVTLGLTSLVGLVLGIVSLVQISKSEGRVRGHGVAVAGTIISGFTLLMLPLMAAILFPVFARAREKARQASCQSNLKQIALGVLMYTQDYDETHPMANNWSDALDPYLKNRQLFLCPSANDLTQRSYAYNQALEQEKMGAIPRPAETIMAFDSQPGANPVGGQELIVWRHNNGANFAFDDGHVKWIRSGVQTNLTWAPAGGAPAGLGGLPPPPWGAPPGMPPDMPGMPPGMPGAPK